MGDKLILGLFLFGFAGAVGAAGGAESLPPPRMEGGMSLMQALGARHSTREFGSRALAPDVLAGLLWAAQGVNRPDTGKRTAPSARDWREIDVYVLTAKGVQVYVPGSHSLRQASDRDLRAASGRQDYPATAPLNLVYVADYARMKDASAEDKAFYAAADTGFIAQNVYLYCASAGLGTVVRGNVDRDALSVALGLGPDQHVTLAQSVGYPKAAP